MGLSLFSAFLLINTFNIATENPVTTKPYRFNVYPVKKCPRSKNEFQTSAQRRNCTRGSRYLCAPDKYLSSLIEFCTDRKRSLFGKDNCLLLEGTGDLDHYNCVEKFNSSCPSEPYYDEEIYKYPACLEIDKELRCFVADKACMKRQLPTTVTHLNTSELENARNETFRGASHWWLAIVYMIIAFVLMILTLVIFRKRNKGTKIVIIEITEASQVDEPHSKKSEEIDDRVLKQFLDEGQLTVRHTRCIIVGCGNAGKTTLLKRLQNVSYEELVKTDRTEMVEETDRTEMVDFHVNCFEVLAEENTIQSIKEKDRLPAVVFSEDNLKKVELHKCEDIETKCEIEKGGNSGIKEKDRLPAVVFSEDNLKKVELQNCEGIETECEIEKGGNSGDKTRNENPKPFSDKEEDVVSMNTKDAASVEEKVKNETSNESVVKPPSSIKTKNSSQILYERIKGTIDTDSDDDDDDDENEEYAISKIKDAVRMLKNEKDLRPRITFLDFAGQNMYYAFHQIFLSPKACSILVVDMTKDLHEKVDVSDTDEKCCSLLKSWTYKDYYKFWLKSIDSFGDAKIPVLVVGTHADKMTKEDKRRFFEDFFKLIDVNHHLKRHVNEDRKFSIGFPEKGKELEDLKDIKTCLAQIVQGSDYLEEKIRPVWAIFEQILIRQKESKKIISRKTLSNYKSKFMINDDEISKMLVFLHRVGTLLYFNEDYLKDKIILDIQWFLDAFKCFINYPLDVGENDIKRKHFYYTGELDDEELERIWKTCPNKERGYLDHKTTILAYMEQLGLLTACTSHYERSLKSTWYYVPCMNKKKFDKTGDGFLKSSILCFKFDDEGQLPIHVFYSIVLKCFKIPGWLILTEKDQICIYDNAACFSYQEHILVFCICKFQIQVQVWWFPEKKDVKLLKGIKESVEKILKGHTKYSYKVGYKCKEGVLNLEEDKSFIEECEFPVSDILCRTCDIDKKHPVSNDICWIQQAENLKNKAIHENKKCDKILGQKNTAKDISEVHESYNQSHTYAGGLSASTNIIYVAAMDFGTSFSGYAFALRVELEKDLSKIHAPVWYTSDTSLVTFKIPTTILVGNDKQFVEFGFEAESTYAELLKQGKHEDYFYFPHFKMMVNNLATTKSLTRDSGVSDVLGRKLSISKLFACAIKYFKDHMLEDLKRRRFKSLETDDIYWVFTVPVIWDDNAKTLMREAAQEAGLPSNQLIIALETEAASIYCKHYYSEKPRDGIPIGVFQPGSKCLVLDAGGENVNVTVHEVQRNGQLKELGRSSSGIWGGNSVDKAFKSALTEIVTAEMLENYIKKYPDDYLSLYRNFEDIKRRCRKGQHPHSLKIPYSFNKECVLTFDNDFTHLIMISKFKDQISLQRDKMKIKLKLFETFFQPACNGIIKHVKDLFKSFIFSNVNIFMVGGFSESCILQDAIQEAFPNCQVIIPDKPSLANLYGAVMLGYDLQSIASRIA